MFGGGYDLLNFNTKYLRLSAEADDAENEVVSDPGEISLEKDAVLNETG